MLLCWRVSNGLSSQELLNSSEQCSTQEPGLFHPGKQIRQRFMLFAYITRSERVKGVYIGCSNQNLHGSLYKIPHINRYINRQPTIGTFYMTNLFSTNSYYFKIKIKICNKFKMITFSLLVCGKIPNMVYCNRNITIVSCGRDNILNIALIQLYLSQKNYHRVPAPQQTSKYHLRSRSSLHRLPRSQQNYEYLSMSSCRHHHGLPQLQQIHDGNVIVVINIKAKT